MSSRAALLAVVAPLLLCIVLLCAALISMSPGRVEAALAPGAVYSGLTHEGHAVSLTVDASAARAELRVAFAPQPGCASSVVLPLTIEAGASFLSAASAASASGTLVNIAAAIHLDPDASSAVAGVFSADPGPDITCPPRRVTFLARRAAPGTPSSAAATPLAPDALYLGSTQAAGLLARAGSADVRTGPSSAVTSILLAHQDLDDCTYALAADTSTLRLESGAFEAQASGGARLTAVVSAELVAGGFYIPAQGDCPAAVGVWSARRVTGSGTLTSGGFPATGGDGLAVFGGGTAAQLLASSGCPAATARFFASDGSGGFVTYVPGTSIAAVNAAWHARFASGLPSGTVLLGRCR